MPRWSNLPLVRRKGNNASGHKEPTRAPKPMVPPELLHNIMDVVPRDALTALMAVNKACNAYVEPILYRHLNLAGYLSLAKAMEQKLRREFAVRRPVNDTRYDRLAPAVCTLTKKAADRMPARLHPVQVVKLPALETIRVSGKLGDEQTLFTLASLSEPSTLVFDYDSCRCSFDLGDHAIPNFPASIVRQIQLVHEQEQALVQDPHHWEYGLDRSTVIVFLPQDLARWSTPGAVATALKKLRSGWHGWFHPVIFVGAEYLGMADTPIPQTVMQALQQGLDEHIGKWWRSEATKEHPYRKWLLAEEGNDQDKAVKRDKALMRWMTLTDFIANEVNDDQIRAEETQGWLKKWAELGAVPLQPIVLPQPQQQPESAEGYEAEDEDVEPDMICDAMDIDDTLMEGIE